MENLEYNTNNQSSNGTEKLPQNSPVTPPPNPKNNFRRTLVILAIFLIVLIIGLVGGVSLYLIKSQPENGQPIIPSSITAETLAHLPPDPRPAGKATIQGIDSDGDGVRDDVQRYIALTYPNSAKTRAALTQVTKHEQKELLDANNKQTAIADLIGDDGSDCLYFIVGSDNVRAIYNELEARILNTRDRSEASILFNQQIGGQGIGIAPIGERKSRCAFSPDTMEN